MTPQEFYDQCERFDWFYSYSDDQCERFDWFYSYSDDHSVWKRGSAAEKALLAHAPEGSANRAIWDAWNKHHYSGAPWGTPKAPRPTRPE